MGFNPGSGSSSSAISTSSDVVLSNPTSRSVLTYDGSMEKWRNGPQPVIQEEQLHSVFSYGAKGDTLNYTAVSISGGSRKTLSVTTAGVGIAFDTSTVGKIVQFQDNGAPGGWVVTTVASVTNATTLQLTDAASATYTGIKAWIGTDDTVALQAAINASMATTNGSGASGGSKLILPPSIGAFWFTSLTAIGLNETQLNIESQGGAILQPSPLGGGAAITIGGSDGTAQSSSSNRKWTLKGIDICATGYWNSATQIDRLAINVTRAGFAHIDNVIISGFKQGAISASNLWDSHINALRIFCCGFSTDDTPTGYAYALNLHGYAPNSSGSGGVDHSNANYWYGLHIEHCPLGIWFQDGSRWNHFIGGKMEFTDKLPDTSSHSPIWFDNAGENEFVSFMWTEDRPPLHDGYTTPKPLILAAGTDGTFQTTYNLLRHNTFIGCDFYGGTGSQGGFTAFSGSDTKFIGCIFNRVYGGVSTSSPAFTLADRNQIENCSFTFIDENIRWMAINGSNNIVDHSYVQAFTLPTPVATLTASSSAGDTVITVGSLKGLWTAGRTIVVDTSTSAETVTIASTNDGTVTLTTALTKAHALGATAVITTTSSLGSFISIGSSASYNEVLGTTRTGTISNVVTTSLTDLGTNKFEDARGSVKTVTTGSTINTFLVKEVSLNYSSATSLSAMTAGYQNQLVTIIPRNANATLTSSSTIIPKGNTTRALATSEIIQMWNDGGVWREL